MSTTTLAIEVDDAELGRIDELATVFGWGRDDVLRRALADYLGREAWLPSEAMLSEIRESLAEADRGEFASEDEVQAVFRSFHTGERM